MFSTSNSASLLSPFCTGEGSSTSLVFDTGASFSISTLHDEKFSLVIAVKVTHLPDFSPSITGVLTYKFFPHLLRFERTVTTMRAVFPASMV